MKQFLLGLLVLSSLLVKGQVQVGKDGGIHPLGRYAAFYGQEGRGGLHHAKTLQERDNIPMNFRDTGMMVVVMQDTSYWVLGESLLNDSWMKMVSNTSTVIVRNDSTGNPQTIDLSSYVTTTRFLDSLATLPILVDNKIQSFWNTHFTWFSADFINNGHDSTTKVVVNRAKFHDAIWVDSMATVINNALTYLKNNKIDSVTNISDTQQANWINGVQVKINKFTGGSGGGGSMDTAFVNRKIQNYSDTSSVTLTNNFTFDQINRILDLSKTGVAAGIYTYPQIQVDVYGRFKAISNGVSPYVSSRILSDTSGYQLVRADGTFDTFKFGGGGSSTSGGSTTNITNIIYQQNMVLDGGYVSWSDSALIFNITPSTFRMNNQIKTSPSSQVVLAPSDPNNDRIDVVAVDSFGHVVVVPGIASPSPVTPQVNTGSQISLTSIKVKAKSTTPDQIYTKTIYDENTPTNPTEWSGFSYGVAPNYEDRSNPAHLFRTTSIPSFADGSALLYQSNSTEQLNQYASLTLYVRLVAAMPTSANISVYFLHDNNPVTSPVMLTNSLGFDKNIIGIWQPVVIPMSAFVAQSGNLGNVIKFAFSGANSTLIQFDLIQLQTGMSTGSSNYITDISLSGTDSVNVVKNGITSFRFKLPSTGTSTTQTPVGTISFLGQTYNINNGNNVSLPTPPSSGSYTASSGLVLQGNNFKIQDTLNGAGTRLMWLKDKAAFRIGGTDSTNVGGATFDSWDIGNVGKYSFAQGLNAKATGIYSFASGHGANASGDYSQSFGQYSSASGIGGFATAYASAGGYLSTALSGSRAFGAQSTGLGNATITSSGNYATAGGFQNYMTGYSGVVFGMNDTVNSTGGAAIGIGLLMNDQGGFAVGSHNTVNTLGNKLGFSLLNRAFQVGIGDSTGREKNGFTVLYNGKVSLDQYGKGTYTGTPTYYLSVDANGNLIETIGTGGGGGTSYTLPAATTTSLGGVKVGSGLDVAVDGTVSVSSRAVTINPGTTSYTFPAGIKIVDVVVIAPTPITFSIGTSQGAKDFLNDVSVTTKHIVETPDYFITPTTLYFNGQASDTVIKIYTLQ